MTGINPYGQGHSPWAAPPDDEPQYLDEVDKLTELQREDFWRRMRALASAGIKLLPHQFVELIEAVTSPVPEISDQPSQPAHADKVAVVYYLKFADRIKIGTTTNLKVRLTAIPHDEVLATEPGGYKLEKARHAQFAEARIRGEWFQATTELLAHAQRLATKDFLDDLDPQQMAALVEAGTGS